MKKLMNNKSNNTETFPQRNICIGPYAGLDLTNESYIFEIAFEKNQRFRTVLTEKEYQTISKVVKRLVSVEASGQAVIAIIGKMPESSPAPPLVS